MGILGIFSGETRERAAQQQFSLSLTTAQRYILRELQAVFSGLEGEEPADLRDQIALLEEAFKAPLPAAIRKRLNTIRRNGITGTDLVRILSDLYHEHEMMNHDFQLRHRNEEESDNHPRIICSEAFI